VADDSRPKSTESGKDSNTWLWLVISAAVLVVVVPVLVGVGMYLVLRRWLTRRDWMLLGVAGIAAGVIGAGNTSVSYFSWLGVVLFGGGNRLAVPMFAVFTYSCVVAAAMGLLAGTAVAAKVPPLLRPKHLGDKPTILPTAAEKQKLSSVPAPVLTADASQHLAVDDAPVGKRSFPIGMDRKGRSVLITENQINMHALVFGGTGSGKSVTLQVLAGGLLDLGWSGMVVDLKEDTKPGGLRDWCNTYANSHAIPYQELRLSDPSPAFWFNPMAGLGQDEARDTILSLTRFDDEYYQNVSKKVLGQLLKLLYWAHEVDPAAFPLPTMYDIAHVLSSTSLPSATKKMRAVVCANLPGVVDDDFHTLSRPSQVEQGQAQSWGAKLGNLYETQAGALALRASSERRMLDVTQPGLTYIGLDSTSKLDLSKVISAAVLQRMSVDAAQRTTGANMAAVKPKFLIIDEASVIDRTIVHALLSKARSAGIAMILATQGPRDWIDRDGDDFAKLGQNTNVAIFMNQGEPESAEMCADYIGHTEYLSATYSHRDGDALSVGSLRQDRDFIVTPDELRRLQIGEAVVRIGKPSEEINWVKVVPRDPNVAARRAPSGPASRFPGGLARPPQ
jgi:hypothetical protein